MFQPSQELSSGFRRRLTTIQTWSQLVVPQVLRDRVLGLGHASIMSGHLGIQKTYDRIVSVSSTWSQLVVPIDVLNKDCRRSCSAILTWVLEYVKISACSH